MALILIGREIASIFKSRLLSSVHKKKWTAAEFIRMKSP